MNSGTAIQPPPLPELREARRERRLAAGLTLLGLAAFGLTGALDPYEPDGRPRSHDTSKSCQPPNLGKMQKLLAQFLWIWWLTRMAQS